MSKELLMPYKFIEDIHPSYDLIQKRSVIPAAQKVFHVLAMTGCYISIEEFGFEKDLLTARQGDIINQYGKDFRYFIKLDIKFPEDYAIRTLVDGLIKPISRINEEQELSIISMLYDKFLYKLYEFLSEFFQNKLDTIMSAKRVFLPENRFFLDQEFHSYFRKPFFGKSRHVIDLISIGICNDSQQYYAICKEFDVDAAWDNEWVRKNVLMDIYTEMLDQSKIDADVVFVPLTTWWPTKKEFKRLLDAYGKTRTEIAAEIVEFVWGIAITGYPEDNTKKIIESRIKEGKAPVFYGYFADYDWVLFCSLFGMMVDLPQGFPMYCRDLKQMLDDYALDGRLRPVNSNSEDYNKLSLDARLANIKAHFDYPIQEKEHNALEDSKWNMALFNFLQEFNKKMYF